MKTGKPQANSQTADEDRLTDREPTVFNHTMLCPDLQWAQKAFVPQCHNLSQIRVSPVVNQVFSKTF